MIQNIYKMLELFIIHNLIYLGVNRVGELERLLFNIWLNYEINVIIKVEQVFKQVSNQDKLLNKIIMSKDC